MITASSIEAEQTEYFLFDVVLKDGTERFICNYNFVNNGNLFQNPISNSTS
jgi:hypothetical protein